LKTGSLSLGPKTLTTLVVDFSRKPNSFPLPDNYEVLTTWEKKANVVKCSIEYENSKPIFRIYYGDKFDQVLETTQSCTATATQIQKKLNPNTRTLLSDTLLFGVQLQILRTAHETRTRKLKAYNKITIKTKNERARNLSKHTRSTFTELSNCFYNSNDNPVLKSLKAIDQGQIPRNSYQIIIPLSNNLVKEWAMSKEKLSINNEMQEKILIYIIKLHHHYSNETLKDASAITDSEVIQMVYESIGNDKQRSIIKIFDSFFSEM
ncbi:2641_t:CDS:2, partial [Funneliformis caledonium]